MRRGAVQCRLYLRVGDCAVLRRPVDDAVQLQHAAVSSAHFRACCSRRGSALLLGLSPASRARWSGSLGVWPTQRAQCPAAQRHALTDAADKAWGARTMTTSARALRGWFSINS